MAADSEIKEERLEVFSDDEIAKGYTLDT